MLVIRCFTLNWISLWLGSMAQVVVVAVSLVVEVFGLKIERVKRCEGAGRSSGNSPSHPFTLSRHDNSIGTSCSSISAPLGPASMFSEAVSHTPSASRLPSCWPLMVALPSITKAYTPLPLRFTS
jgi:hypothetical protein